MADDFQVHFSQTEYGPLEDYAEEHSSRGGTLLEELVRTTWQRSIHPRMLSARGLRAKNERARSSISSLQSTVISSPCAASPSLRHKAE